MADELQSLKAKLARRDKQIAEYKDNWRKCVADLKNLETSMKTYKHQIDRAREAMLVFLNLDELEEKFLNKVDEEFAVVRQQKHWEVW